LRDIQNFRSFGSADFPDRQENTIRQLDL